MKSYLTPSGCTFTAGIQLMWQSVADWPSTRWTIKMAQELPLQTIWWIIHSSRSTVSDPSWAPTLSASPSTESTSSFSPPKTTFSPWANSTKTRTNSSKNASSTASCRPISMKSMIQHQAIPLSFSTSSTLRITRRRISRTRLVAAPRTPSKTHTTKGNRWCHLLHRNQRNSSSKIVTLTYMKLIGAGKPMLSRETTIWFSLENCQQRHRIIIVIICQDRRISWRKFAGILLVLRPCSSHWWW